MKKFIVKLLLFGVMVSSIILYWCFIQRNDVLVLTNSISLDTRLHEMREIKLEHLDIVGIGSSMTLYHLDGETFMDKMEEDISFYNFSAWGMSVADDEKMLQYIVDRYTPKAVIMFSNIVDFKNNTDSQINMENVKAYLDEKIWNDLKLFINYGFPNNIETKKLYKDRRFQPTELNEDLRYDSWGGVRLSVYGDDVLDVRNNMYYQDTPSEIQYEALESMVQYCSEKGVRFYFVQMPYRKHFVSGDEKVNEKMALHFVRCQQIVEEGLGGYLELVNLEKYSDQYFADAIHMNGEGAILLTEEFAEWFKKKWR